MSLSLFLDSQSFPRLLLDREDRTPLFVCVVSVTVFSYGFLIKVRYLGFCRSVDYF